MPHAKRLIVPAILLAWSSLDKYKDYAGYAMQLPAIIQSAYPSLTKYR